MFKRVYSWRLKRRQHALALAWCGDQGLANWLLDECHSDAKRLNRVQVYRRMADVWQQHADGARAQHSDLHEDPESPHDPMSCRVRQLIAQMPVSQRMTLGLVDVARLSYRETAAVMNIGIFEVQYHIVTARRQLLDELHTGSQLCADLDPTEPAESF